MCHRKNSGEYLGRESLVWVTFWGTGLMYLKVELTKWQCSGGYSDATVSKACKKLWRREQICVHEVHGNKSLFDNGKRALRGVTLKRSSDGDTDHTLAKQDQIIGVQEVVEGVWLGAVPFFSIISTMHIVRKDFAVAFYLKEVTWPYSRYLVDKI